jgi:hypothetical protein
MVFAAHVYDAVIYTALQKFNTAAIKVSPRGLGIATMRL